MNCISLDAIASATFAELVGSNFSVQRREGTAIKLQLAAMSSPSSGQSAPRGCENFSLIFDGPTDPALTQGTFRFEHERIGCFDLFIVPISAERDLRQYEAVFSRRIPHVGPS
jgi:hypothetical protein